MTSRESQMTSWAVQEAKARFSESLDRCLSDGPQILTRDGKDEAVLVSIEEWRRLQPERKPSLKHILMHEGPKLDLPIPRRGRLRMRPPIEFD